MLLRCSWNQGQPVVDAVGLSLLPKAQFSLMLGQFSAVALRRALLTPLRTVWYRHRHVEGSFGIYQNPSLEVIDTSASTDPIPTAPKVRL